MTLLEIGSSLIGAGSAILLVTAFMGAADLRERLRDLPGGANLTLQPGVVIINNQTIPLGTASTDDEIAELIQRSISKIHEITGNIMSITGLQSGAFQAKLAEMRQKIANSQAQGLAKIDAAVTAGAAELDAAAENAAKKAQNEIADALQEFSLTTNGGPA
jgi:hypothetical protein